MVFDWDAANAGHLAAHPVTPDEAEQALLNEHLTIETQRVGDEERTVCLGRTNAGRLLTFIYTERANKIRFVTVFPMSKHHVRVFLREMGQ